MMYRLSRENCERMRLFSASATFFAAWNEPRNAIDQERSSIITVAVCVSCSERNTSKSSGDRCTGAPRPSRSRAFMMVLRMSR